MANVNCEKCLKAIMFKSIINESKVFLPLVKGFDA